jgi:hypothetical protein
VSCRYAIKANADRAHAISVDKEQLDAEIQDANLGARVDLIMAELGIERVKGELVA